MKTIRLLAGLAVFFFAAHTAMANIYYVRSGATGDDNGADWDNAYPSLPEKLVRGATYYIASGSYPGYTFDDPASGSLVTSIKKATASDHGTSRGWKDNYAEGQAMFAGMIEFTSSHWVFDGMTGGGAENNWNRNFGFKIIVTEDANAVIRIGYSGTANNIMIRHVDMQGKGSATAQGGYYSNDGLAVYGASNITLSYFWMHGIGRGPFFIDATNAVVEHGWIESYYGSRDIHSEIASIWSFASNGKVVGDTTFRYNLFTDIQSTGGLMWDNSRNPSAHLYVYGNVFYRPSGANWQQANGVIGGWTGGHGEQFHNCWVYNNTFINIDHRPLSNLPTIHSGNIVKNNIFYNCAPPDFSRFGTHDYNVFINSGGAHSEPNGIAASSGDPFVDYVNLNFMLKKGTAAGTSLSSPFNLDPFGNTRGGDGTWDRGAFEFGGTRSSLERPRPPVNLRVQ